MGIKAISLKYHLSGEVEEFLENELMPCNHTKGGVVELINQISAYTEEGKALFPEVYILDDLKTIQQPLINCEIIPLGCEDKSSKVMLQALKKCAPLAFGGWAIYLLRIGTNFEFGLFRSGSTIVSVPIATSLIVDGNKESNIILVRQVADKIVEVKGSKGNAIVINFGIRSTSDLSPLIEHEKIIKGIISNIDAEIKDQCITFLKRLFLYVMQNGHGNLSLVISDRCDYPEYLGDGIKLLRPVSFAERIMELKKASLEADVANVLDANSKLNGVFNLIAGMMLSDGITVFCNNGSVVAYNIFLKHPENDADLKNVSGGARSRTFEIMKRKLSQEIPAVYIQSQDGNTQTELYEPSATLEK